MTPRLDRRPCYRCGRPGAFIACTNLPREARVHTYCLSDVDQPDQATEDALLARGRAHSAARRRKGFE
jgi:hypothetical protein